jgi:hypothetical protein
VNSIEIDRQIPKTGDSLVFSCNSRWLVISGFDGKFRQMSRGQVLETPIASWVIPLMKISL